MGIVVRQGIYNTVFQYLGLFLGFINSVLLFPKVFSFEEIGDYNLLISSSFIFAQIAGFGISAVYQKYYHQYQKLAQHNEFTTFIIVLQTLVLMFFSIAYFLFYDLLNSYFNKEGDTSQLSVLQVFLFTFITIYTNLLDVFLRTVYKGVLSVFTKEFLLRFIVALVLVYAYFYNLEFQSFQKIFIALNLMVLMVLLFQSIKYRIIHSYKILDVNSEAISSFFKYAFFVLLAGSANVIIIHVDNLMLNDLDSKKMVGIYSIFFTLASLISIPARGLGRVVNQIVLESIAKNDIEKTREMYYKSSLTQLFAGIVLFLLLRIWIIPLISFIGKPELLQYIDILSILAMAFIVDSAGGLNVFILSISDEYWKAGVILISALLICIILNYLLIPIQSAMGAAYSFFITYIFINGAFNTVLWLKYQIKPFLSNHLILFFYLGVAILVVQVNINLVDNSLINSVFYSALLVFPISIWVLYKKVLPELNDLLNTLINKLK